MAVRPVPDGYHAVTPYLVMKQAAQALAYYDHAFGAIETLRLTAPDGRIGHAEVRIGDSMVMLADEHPELGHVGPQTLGGSAVSLMVYVPDVDKVFARAIAAGAKEKKPIADQFYGDRCGTLEDPFGHVWTIATHVEDVAADEIERRVAKLYGQGG
jgi:PhnB protein